MTTLVALNTMDALVMGCDTLGTVTQTFVDPFRLVEYFDPDEGFTLRLGPDGKPLLDNFSKVFRRSQQIPYNHMTHVDKLFSRKPLPMGIMFAGLVYMGERTIKSPIDEFKASLPEAKGRAKAELGDYTLENVGQQLLDLFWLHHSKEFPDERVRPELELMLGGYDKGRPTPGVVTLDVQKNELKDVARNFGLHFGAQTQEIERLAYGIDLSNWLRLKQRVHLLLNRYHELLTKELPKGRTRVQLKLAEDFGDELDIFNNWGLDGLYANWGAFSEQNAIDCVDFLVNIMIRSQQFSDQMPTVGGDVQIGIINRDRGFSFISKREWRYGSHSVPVEGE